MEGSTMTNFLLGAMFTITITLIGVIYTSLSNRVSKVESKANSLELLVSGKYQLRSEADAMEDKLFSKLDEIQKDIHACRLDHHSRRKDDPNPGS